MIQREEIQSVFAEMLDRIADRSLREKVLDAWMLGIERGGWKSMTELREMPFTLVTQTCGINFIEHTLAVTRGALGLAKAQTDSYAKMPFPINLDRLIAGGLLHDVGKLLEIERHSDGSHGKSRAGAFARHPLSGALLAAEVGLPEDIINIIACHAKEGEGAPQVVETVLIHQADFAVFDPLVMMTKGLLIQ
jgi:putative nucleotidyltransferase with HDIG domain